MHTRLFQGLSERVNFCYESKNDLPGFQNVKSFANFSTGVKCLLVNYKHVKKLFVASIMDSVANQSIMFRLIRLYNRVIVFLYFSLFVFPDIFCLCSPILSAFFSNRAQALAEYILVIDEQE